MSTPKYLNALIEECPNDRIPLNGLYGSPEYRVWMNLISRCENINNPRYAQYGGRGIKVCPSWRRSFHNFLADVGLRPEGRNASGKLPLYSLDRIDNNGNYCPENCRWTTFDNQCASRRGRGKAGDKAVFDIDDYDPTTDLDSLISEFSTASDLRPYERRQSA